MFDEKVCFEQKNKSSNNIFENEDCINNFLELSTVNHHLISNLPQCLETHEIIKSRKINK